MKVDIGCGTGKHAGFFGLDNQPYSGVDLVCDIEVGIPLPDNCVQFVMASRSLPYVRDLMAVMLELYRICAHQAIVCVLAPYAHHFRHLSNPYIRQRFDEYTPRYLTAHFFQPPDSPVCPPIDAYTIDQPAFDFRLLRMELFYSPPLEPPLYESDELDILMQLQPNVVSEIMYHFVVVKRDITPDELLRLCGQTFEEPAQAQLLRGEAAARQSVLSADAEEEEQEEEQEGNESPPISQPERHAGKKGAKMRRRRVSKRRLSPRAARRRRSKKARRRNKKI